MAKQKQLTPKQGHFARCVASGMNLSDSYKEAYSSNNMSDKTVNEAASRLMANSMLTARVHDLNAAKDSALIAAAVSDREMVLKTFRELVFEGATDQARLRAGELLGRTIGLFTDTKAKEDKRSAAQIRTELQTKLAALADPDTAH